MTNNENIKRLVVNIENEDWENAYFVFDVMNTLRGVYDVEIEEYSNDGDTDYLDELNVILSYDSTLWTIETLMDCVEQARQDTISFYMELQRNDLHCGIEEYDEETYLSE